MDSWRGRSIIPVLCLLAILPGCFSMSPFAPLAPLALPPYAPQRETVNLPPREEGSPPSPDAKVTIQGTITYPDGSPVAGRRFYFSEVDPKEPSSVLQIIHVPRDGNSVSGYIFAQTDEKGYFKVDVFRTDIKGKETPYTLIGYPKNDLKATPFAIFTKDRNRFWFSIGSETKVFDFDRAGGAVFGVAKELDVVSTRDISFPDFITSLKFYESDYDPAPIGERAYQERFEGAKTRYINWEVSMRHPLPGERIDFEVEAIWRRADGSILGRPTTKSFMEPDWTLPSTTSGWGNRQAGAGWKAGKYTVELLIGGKKIATGSFEVY